jgi:hypothetical protein
LNQVLLLSLVKDGLLMSQSFLTGCVNMERRALIILYKHPKNSETPQKAIDLEQGFSNQVNPPMEADFLYCILGVLA